jgi:hypothetical protein
MSQATTRRYLILGVVSTLFSLFVHPVAGLGSIYSGYKIKGRAPTLYSALLAGVGGFFLVLWLTYLVTV